MRTSGWQARLCPQPPVRDPDAVADDQIIDWRSVRQSIIRRIVGFQCHVAAHYQLRTWYAVDNPLPEVRPCPFIRRNIMLHLINGPRSSPRPVPGFINCGLLPQLINSARNPTMLIINCRIVRRLIITSTPVALATRFIDLVPGTRSINRSLHPSSPVCRIINLNIMLRLIIRVRSIVRLPSAPGGTRTERAAVRIALRRPGKPFEPWRSASGGPGRSRRPRPVPRLTASPTRAAAGIGPTRRGCPRADGDTTENEHAIRLRRPPLHPYEGGTMPAGTTITSPTRGRADS